MGVYSIKCPVCEKDHQWFSGSSDQRCHECKGRQMTPITESEVKNAMAVAEKATPGKGYINFCQSNGTEVVLCGGEYTIHLSTKRKGWEQTQKDAKHLIVFNSSFSASLCASWLTLSENLKTNQQIYKELEIKCTALEELVSEMERAFRLMLITPIEPPKTVNEFERLWKRDKRDAEEVLERLRKYREGEK